MDEVSTPAWSVDEPSRRRTTRTSIVLALAVVPWLALGLLGWRAVTGPDPTGAPIVATPRHDDARADDAGDHDPHEPPTRHGDVAPDVPEGPVAPPAAARSDAPWDADVAPSGERPATDGDAAATAVATVRAWLTSPGAPVLTVDGIEPVAVGYLEHATVRRLEVVAEDAVVASVSVLVLTVEDGSYGDVLHLEVGVPLHVADGRVTPAGTPWWGPAPPQLTSTSRAGAPVEDEPVVRHAAEEALRRAGFREVTVGAVDAIAPGLVRAEVRATTPVGIVHDGPVWFARQAGSVRLLGPGGDADPPPDGPSEDPGSSGGGPVGPEDAPQAPTDPTDPRGQEPT